MRSCCFVVLLLFGINIAQSIPLNNDTAWIGNLLESSLSNQISLISSLTEHFEVVEQEVTEEPPEEDEEEDNIFASWFGDIKDNLFDSVAAVEDIIDTGVHNITSGIERTEEVLDEVASWDLFDAVSAITGSDFKFQFPEKRTQENNWWNKLGFSVNNKHESSNTQEIDDLDSKIHSFQFYNESLAANSDLPPECFMNTTQLIRYAEYPCSTYNTVTEDGYVLTMHRIPYGQGKSGNSEHNDTQPVVFLQHGLLADSSTWCSSGPNRSLAFKLADEGYDVWMGNSRGNLYSRSHVSLNPDIDNEYWKFSWQHMSEYDLPAMIDTVLNETGRKKVYYIGHSQGSLIAFTKLADDPEFNEKLHLMIGLGPVATLGSITSPIQDLAQLHDLVHLGVKVWGGSEILPRTKLSTWLVNKMHTLAGGDRLTYRGSNLLLFLVGFNADHYHRDRLPVILSHIPSGTSLHNIIHFSQLVNSGKTQKWSYLTSADNLEKYGTPVPPEYNFSNITAPVALFVGSEDKLADPVDAKKLADKLVTLDHYETLEGWDHLDFIWGNASFALSENTNATSRERSEI